jgi:dihydropyrimidine dehydrogenase (NAD+) subunit PreA
MWKGYGIIDKLIDGLGSYLDDKDLVDLKPIIGAALPKIVAFPEMPLDPRARARVDDTCNGCMLCITACSDGGFQAITGMKGEIITIDGDKCDGCGLCVMICPSGSITMVPR